MVAVGRKRCPGRKRDEAKWGKEPVPVRKDEDCGGIGDIDDDFGRMPFGSVDPKSSDTVDGPEQELSL